jgi:N-acetylmuramoyl-L-alanine amidase
VVGSVGRCGSVLRLGWIWSRAVSWLRIIRRRASLWGGGVAVLAALFGAACGSAGSSTRRVTRAVASTVTVTAPATTVTTPSTAAPGTTAPPPTKPKPKKTLPLAGKRVGIDPGHNGNSYTDPSFINAPIWNGRETETCDTTGTETDGGYTEARYNWNVANFLRADLIAEGAQVILTRHSNTGVGPCVTTRAQIINRFHANVAVDIHADGGPPDGRGFAILLPVADGPNDHVIAASKAFGLDLRSRFLAVTHMPESSYDGVDGFEPRDDLAGLNLTTVPKVLIECGNMRDATDAALLVTGAFQRHAAEAMAQAITAYLTAR